MHVARTLHGYGKGRLRQTVVDRFNPAPGWPPAPEGWLPPSDWQPDPSWPPAPAGWAFVIDQNDQPTGPSSADPSRGASSRSVSPRDWASPTPTPSTRVGASTIALTVVATIASLSVIFTLAGIPALVLALSAWATRANPVRSRQLTRIGWIVFGSVILLGVVATILDYMHSP
jgi:hypothetical protein